MNQEFLERLTDPQQNGGGALMDFGCYGANLIIWLMQGERPTSVMAVTQQIKPEVYPKPKPARLPTMILLFQTRTG